MQTAKDFDHEDVAEESESDTSRAEDDSCGSVDLQTADRSCSDALLDLSAECSLKEQEPCDPYYSSGWEEAVQGWSRVTALGCMFLPQRKRRKPKTDEQPPHCLLCIDMRPPEALSVDRAPEFCPESQVNPQDRGANNATPPGLPTALYSNTADSALLKETPQCPPFGAHQHHFLLRDKMADGTVDRDVHSPCHINSNSKHPATKCRHYDLGLPINIFTVLPPVRTPQLKSQRVTQQVSFGESTAGGSSEAGSVVPQSARESRGAGRTEEAGGAASVTNPEPSKDTYRAIAPPTPMYYPPSQENRQLLTTFTVPILKRYEVPLSNISDTVHHHQTTISIGRHWKQALRTGNEYRRHARSTTPQLPILLGTKVPIVSGQRKTSLNTLLLCAHSP